MAAHRAAPPGSSATHGHLLPQDQRRQWACRRHSRRTPPPVKHSTTFLPNVLLAWRDVSHSSNREMTAMTAMKPSSQGIVRMHARATSVVSERGRLVPSGCCSENCRPMADRRLKREGREPDDAFGPRSTSNSSRSDPSCKSRQASRSSSISPAVAYRSEARSAHARMSTSLTRLSVQRLLPQSSPAGNAGKPGAPLRGAVTTAWGGDHCVAR